MYNFSTSLRFLLSPFFFSLLSLTFRFPFSLFPHSGIKVLREDDTDHSPCEFERRNPRIGLIVDISRENPPYLPTNLTTCAYHKMPTVSKVHTETQRKMMHSCDPLSSTALLNLWAVIFIIIIFIKKTIPSRFFFFFCPGVPECGECDRVCARVPRVLGAES